MHQHTFFIFVACKLYRYRKQQCQLLFAYTGCYKAENFMYIIAVLFTLYSYCIFTLKQRINF